MGKLDRGHPARNMLYPGPAPHEWRLSTYKEIQEMFKRMSVVICGLAVMLVTAGPAIAQGDAAADAATTTAFKTKLFGDTKVPGLNIDVDTKDNVVTLTGKVKNAAARTEGVRLARTTTGVKSVVNHITIDPT